MRMTNLAIGVAVAFLGAGCTTVATSPGASGKECFYPACTINVQVVDDGKGGKRLALEADGNIRMGTRHRLVAIIWNLKTPGYEFRGDSILPQANREASDRPWTSYGSWSSQFLPHEYWTDTYSVTDINNERGIYHYEITVYPDRYTPGEPMTFQAAIANDAHQGRDGGWVSMQ
jgi:hypothetical protein